MLPPMFFQWVHGKPVITGRASLWLSSDCNPTPPFGYNGCRNTTNVADLLNAQAAKPGGVDPTSSTGYSVIPVWVWGADGTVAGVLDVISQLDLSVVEVVGLDALVELVAKHVDKNDSTPSEPPELLKTDDVETGLGSGENCSAMLPPGTSVRSEGCCLSSSGGNVVPCSSQATPHGDCASSLRCPKPDPPQFHVMDKTCDENDPNAPFYLNGVYHLFYQKHCAEPVPGKKIKGIVYGHVASRDLIHWTHLPVAIWNDQKYDNIIDNFLNSRSRGLFHVGTRQKTSNPKKDDSFDKYKPDNQGDQGHCQFLYRHTVFVDNP